MKYKTEVEALLREVLYEDWMNENDYNEIKDTTLKSLGVTTNMLNDQIELGVNNGYSPEIQIAVVKSALS